MNHRPSRHCRGRDGGPHLSRDRRGGVRRPGRAPSVSCDGNGVVRRERCRADAHRADGNGVVRTASDVVRRASCGHANGVVRTRIVRTASGVVRRERCRADVRIVRTRERCRATRTVSCGHANGVVRTRIVRTETVSCGRASCGRGLRASRVPSGAPVGHGLAENRAACDRAACDRAACDRAACDRAACDRAAPTTWAPRSAPENSGWRSISLYTLCALERSRAVMGLERVRCSAAKPVCRTRERFQGKNCSTLARCRAERQ
jgi:hypothetical protein